MKGVFALAMLVGGLSAAQADPLPTFRIGVLNDQSGLYADIAGPGSVEAARMAVEDFKPDAQGFRVDVLSADHQNKPDIGAAIVATVVRRRSRRRDRGRTDLVGGPGRVEYREREGQGVPDRQRRFLGSDRAELHPNERSLDLRHLGARQQHGARGDQAGRKIWYFLTTDYAFGHALERDATEAVTKAGGTSLGHVLAPFQSTDYSSYLLQAQGSGAQVVALANSGGDTINAIKQASEFGLTDGGQKLVALLAFISDIHSVGLKVAHGLTLTEAFYWDLNDGTRAWAKRFAARNGGRYPTMNQGGHLRGDAPLDEGDRRPRQGTRRIVAPTSWRR